MGWGSDEFVNKFNVKEVGVEEYQFGSKSQYKYIVDTMDKRTRQETLDRRHKNTGQEILDKRHKTRDTAHVTLPRSSGQEALNKRHWTTGTGQQALDKRHWTRGTGQEALDIDKRHWTRDTGDHAPDTIHYGHRYLWHLYN